VTPLWRLYNSVSAVKYLWVAAHIVFVECSGVKIAAKVRLLSDNDVLIENLSTSWTPVLTEILSYTDFGYSQQAEVLPSCRRRPVFFFDSQIVTYFMDV
jgi:hypothetical protein